MSPEEGGDGAADLGGGVLLDEVAAANRDLLLVRPPAAKLALPVGEAALPVPVAAPRQLVRRQATCPLSTAARSCGNKEVTGV